MISSRATVWTATIVAPVPRRLFGTFVEHMGRGVYGGIYEPGGDDSDESGFRTDVLELVHELGATTARYPGGNFVSGYNWQDGVGPVADRPVRLDAAWHSTETNTVGLHEFAEWAKLAGLEIMQAVNLGTRGIADAAELLEYSNHPHGTELSERRRANGADAPFDIRLWCLGNEVDGPWQIGHKTADEYGRLAAETARLMRFIDPNIELVAAGSSNESMPTFGDWERTVLTLTAGLVDHISVHAYYEEIDGDVDSFLASGVGLDRYLDHVAAIIDEVVAAEGLDRTIGISVDEWNVWYQRRWNDIDKPRVLTGDWPRAPRLLEDEYSVTDAVVVGSLLISLLRHSDRVTMANLAQLVNVIAPIRAEPGRPAWRQSTFFPFAAMSRYARGDVMRTALETASMPTSRYGDVDVLDVVTTLQENAVSIFVVNRSTSEPAELELTLDLDGLALVAAETLCAPEGGDRHTTNTVDAQPVGLRPLAPVEVHAGDSVTRVSALLPALSWSMIRLERVLA